MNKKKIKPFKYLLVLGSVVIWSCQPGKNQENTETVARDSVQTVQPVYVTDKVDFDSDDPAIWINPNNPEQSLVLGTDKGGDEGKGGIYVFDLQGNLDTARSVRGIQRPNNIDIEYGFVSGNDTFDIAVFTERYANAIRVFRLPEMEPVDNGGIEVFAGEDSLDLRSPMGIGLYKRPSTGQIFAIVSRKFGGNDNYLWQYKLIDNDGRVTGEKVREFGQFSGNKEIEAVAVDDPLGYVYYSDEGVGVRKYYADPDSSNQELALFATEGFAEDHEGISIYPTGPESGYILVSDQQANTFHLFNRTGSTDNPHQHDLQKVVKVSTLESDGSEITATPLGQDFSRGLFVAMSDDGTFQYYRAEDILPEQ